MAKARMKSNKPMATNKKAMANKNGGLMGGLELDWKLLWSLCHKLIYKILLNIAEFVVIIGNYSSKFI